MRGGNISNYFLFSFSKKTMLCYIMLLVKVAELKTAKTEGRSSINLKGRTSISDKGDCLRSSTDNHSSSLHI